MNPIWITYQVEVGGLSLSICNINIYSYLCIMFRVGDIIIHLHYTDVKYTITQVFDKYIICGRIDDVVVIGNCHFVKKSISHDKEYLRDQKLLLLGIK